MPISPPPAVVLKELFGSTTRHTRRVEIYEADGVTRWVKDVIPRLRSGSVTVDYSRDERRALDLTLSNSDGVLKNAPGEFWYDKIIKVFRGVAVNEAVRLPKILIIEDIVGANSQAVAFRNKLVSLGFGDIRINTLASVYSVDIAPYDIIVALGGGTKNRVLKQAYDAGKSVYVAGLSAGGLMGLLFPGSMTGSAAVATVTRGSTVTHPVARGWSAFNIQPYSNGSMVILPETGYTHLTNQVTYSSIGVLTHASSGGRVVLFQPIVTTAQYGDVQFSNFMLSAFDWLNTVVPLLSWEVQIGEFMIDRIDEPNFPHDIKITGRDYTKKCLASKYAQSTQFVSGQTLEAIITSIAGASGITKRILPVTGIVVGRTFFFERGVSRWDAMKEIVNAYNYEIFFDAQGYLIIRPYNDPTLTPPSVWVETGPDGSLASYGKSTTDTRIYNYIVVAGESSDSAIPPVYAVAYNRDILSPTCIQAIGERTFFYTSSFLTTTSQCQDVADSFLAVHALEEFVLSFESLLLPWLEVGEILGWIDPRAVAGDPNMFLLSSITLPLSLGPMSCVGKRIRNVNPAIVYVKATFTSVDTAAGVVPNADTGQVFTQTIVGGSGTPGWKILNNTVIDPSVNTDSFLTLNAERSDGVFSVTVTGLPIANTSAGMAIRMDSPSSSSCIYIDIAAGATSYSCYRRVAGVFTLLCTVAKTPAVGDVIMITAHGSSLKFSVGSVSATAVDSTGINGRYFGLRAYGNIANRTSSFDNLQATS